MPNHFLHSISFALCCFSLLLGRVSAETEPCSVKAVDDYGGWGWKSWVMKNGLITLAIVPEIGGRVMEYDLDEHPSIYVNPAEVGKRYNPAKYSGWPNYGGYKTWPAPQSKWLVGGGGWPPPPYLDFGPYSCEVVSDSTDSCVVYLKSPVESSQKYACRGLRFERRLTIYRGSTRVKVEQTLVNTGDQKVTWSVWDVTQSIVNHPSETDYENFWVYFPVKAKSKFGEKGYHVLSGDTSDSQWKKEIAPGICGVQYLHHGGKIAADSDGGWICYVDQKDGYAYAKKFAYFEGETYPDNGASVEVFTSSGLPYLEVEVLSPLVDLAPDKPYTFVENWYATRCDGPILEVNNAGVIKERLAVETIRDSVRMTGSYGVFYLGQLKLVFKNAQGKEISCAKSYPVSPLSQFSLDEKCSIPAKTKQVELQLSDTSGQFVGILDSISLTSTDVELLQEGREDGSRGISSAEIRQAYLRNWPNPFTQGTEIQYLLPEKARVELSIWNLWGQKVTTLVRGEQKAGNYSIWWNGKDQSGKDVSTGVYLCELKGNNFSSARKILCLR